LETHEKDEARSLGGGVDRDGRREVQGTHPSTIGARLRRIQGKQVAANIIINDEADYPLTKAKQEPPGAEKPGRLREGDA
jgi:hypothetical protein